MNLYNDFMGTQFDASDKSPSDVSMIADTRYNLAREQAVSSTMPPVKRDL